MNELLQNLIYRNDQRLERSFTSAATALDALSVRPEDLAGAASARPGQTQPLRSEDATK